MFRNLLTLSLITLIGCVKCQQERTFGNFMHDIKRAHEHRRNSEIYSEEINSMKQVFHKAANIVKDFSENPETFSNLNSNDGFSLDDGLKAPSPYNVTEECQNSTNIVLQAIAAGEQWALRSTAQPFILT